jgi:hypothetical protein
MRKQAPEHGGFDGVALVGIELVRLHDACTPMNSRKGPVILPAVVQFRDEQPVWGEKTWNC